MATKVQVSYNKEKQLYKVKDLKTKRIQYIDDVLLIHPELITSIFSKDYIFSGIIVNKISKKSFYIQEQISNYGIKIDTLKFDYMFGMIPTENLALWLFKNDNKFLKYFSKKLTLSSVSI